MSKRKTSLTRIAEGATPTMVILSVLLGWELLVRWRDIAPIYLPPPSTIVIYLFRMIGDGSIEFNLGVTLLRIFAGFAIAALAGVTLGVLMGMSRLIARIVDPWIAALYPLPKIALIPLLVIWLGTGELYKIVISAVTAFFPIVISTYAGIRQTDRGLIKAAQIWGQSPANPIQGGHSGRDSQHLCRASARHGSYGYPDRRCRDDRQLEPERNGLFAHTIRAGYGNRKGFREPGRACDCRRTDHQAAAMGGPENSAMDGLP